MKRLVIMGPPGVGKGTQSEWLAASLGIPAISTGDVFREHVRTGTKLGIQVKDLLASGAYVPDDITNRMVAERLDRADASEGFLLDGYPRTLLQVDELDRLLARVDAELDLVLLLRVDQTELVSRLLLRAERQGRADDTPEVVTRRISVYQNETAPLADAFQARGLLVTIDGSGSPEVVGARIAAALRFPREPTEE
jgi:adenylate kinase